MKIILRSLGKQKFFTFLNIFGLASGMLCCMIILLYVGNESSYDAFHANKDNLYRVAFRMYTNGEATANSAVNFAPAGPLVKQNLPGVQEYCRLYTVKDVVVEKNGTVFTEETITYADPSFLRMFSFPLLEGNARTALQNPNSVVLTEELAKKYFGKANAVGKTLRVRYRSKNQTEGGEFTVTGIMKDVPANSHLQFKALFSFQFFGQSFQDNWSKYAFHTYVSLRPDANPAALEAKLTPLFNKTIPYLKDPGTVRAEFFLQPLKNIYLHSDLEEEAGPTGNGRIIHLLIGIAVFILAVALVNFVNLSTARSIERAKEIGIRKVLGSTKEQLIVQFYKEAFLIQTISMGLAILAMLLLMPFISQLTGQPLGSYLFAGNPSVTYQPWLIIAGIFLVSLVFSGIYPALVLSSYNPLSVLKGKPVRTAGGLSTRKALVVVQFVISISLAIGSYIIYSQIRYLTSADLGININHVLVVKAPIIASDSAYARSTVAFKNELTRNSTFGEVATANVIPGKLMDTNTGGIRRIGAPKTDASTYSKGEIDYHFLDVFDLKLVAGRNFSERFPTDNQAVIINEAAVRQLGFSSPEE
ncbi:MAG: ABC transporter permease, partial [Cytophagales bacterium]|nr:ABC transporter permease [Cytophagales bacterium]